MRLLSFLIIFQLSFPVVGFSQTPTPTPGADEGDNVELDAKQQAMLDKLMEKEKSYEKRKIEAEKMLTEFVKKQNALSVKTKEGEIEESAYKNQTQPSVVDPIDSKITYWRGNYPITLENSQLKFLAEGDTKDFIIKYIVSHPNYDDLEGIYQINFGNTCSVPVSFANANPKATYLTQLPYNSEAGKAFFDQLASIYKPGEEDDDAELKNEDNEPTSRESILTHYKYFAPKSSMINSLLHNKKISQSSKKKNGVRLLPTEVVFEGDLILQVEDKSTAAPVPAKVEDFPVDILAEDPNANKKEESAYKVSDKTKESVKAALLKKIKEQEDAGKEVKLLGAVCRSSASRISVTGTGPSQVGSASSSPVFKTKELDTYSNISPEIQKGCEGPNPAGCNHKLSALRRVHCMAAVEDIVEKIRNDKKGVVSDTTSMLAKDFDADKKYYKDPIRENYASLIKKDPGYADKVPFYIFPGSDVGENGDGTSGPEYYMCAIKAYADKHANCQQKDKKTGKPYGYPAPSSRADAAASLKELNDKYVSKNNQSIPDSLTDKVDADYYHESQYAQMYFVYLVKDKPKTTPNEPKVKEIKCKEYAVIQLYMDKDAKKKCIVEDKKTKEPEIKECSGSTGGKKRKHRKRGGAIIIDCKSKPKGIADCVSFRNKRPLCRMFKRIVEKIAN